MYAHTCTIPTLVSKIGDRFNCLFLIPLFMKCALFGTKSAGFHRVGGGGGGGWHWDFHPPPQEKFPLPCPGFKETDFMWMKLLSIEYMIQLSRVSFRFLCKGKGGGKTLGAHLNFKGSKTFSRGGECPVLPALS